MDQVFVLVVVLAVTLGFTVGTGRIAERKGRSFAAWAAIGFFFGVFGMLLAVVMPKKSPAY